MLKDVYRLLRELHEKRIRSGRLRLIRAIKRRDGCLHLHLVHGEPASRVAFKLLLYSGPATEPKGAPYWDYCRGGGAWDGWDQIFLSELFSGGTKDKV